MRVVVVGLGYVGSVSSGCLADSATDRGGREPGQGGLAAGESPIVETGLPGLIRAQVAGRLTATTSIVGGGGDRPRARVRGHSLGRGRTARSLARAPGAPTSVAEALKGASGCHVVVLRSTVLPGTMEEDFLPALAAGSGLTPGRDFGVAYNPEFLREGSALSDFESPPYTVVAATDERSIAAIRELYAGIEAPFIVTSFRAAEMLKYVNNTFHALKVAFANEVGNICKSAGVDSHEVMELFCRDTKLNISPTYLPPGFAFGGSCLPKDLRALNSLARRHDLDLPLLAGISHSNECT